MLADWGLEAEAVGVAPAAEAAVAPPNRAGLSSGSGRTVCARALAVKLRVKPAAAVSKKCRQFMKWFILTDG